MDIVYEKRVAEYTSHLIALHNARGAAALTPAPDASLELNSPDDARAYRHAREGIENFLSIYFPCGPVSRCYPGDLERHREEVLAHVRAYQPTQQNSAA